MVELDLVEKETESQVDVCIREANDLFDGGDKGDVKTIAARRRGSRIDQGSELRISIAVSGSSPSSHHHRS